MKYKYIVFSLLGILLPMAHTLAQSTPATHSLNPLGDTSGGAPELYGRILRLLLGFSGVGALMFFVWGGITLLMSRGNPDKVKAGKDTLMWAIIGLVVAFSSYIILRFVIQALVTRDA